jgi:AcrR family transcriptional regulator
VNVSVDTESLQRPLRADARRNREAILKAARAVFSARGREGHLEEVARRAKVGMGTVYRHFPTKEALLEALAREQFDLHACTEALLTRAKEEGTVRADATGEDIRLMMCGLGSVMQMGGDSWRRYLTVMLDGMRAG